MMYLIFHFSIFFLNKEKLIGKKSPMYSMFGDPDLADMFVALNNQNYLWATPFDLDAFEDAIDFRMNYVELLMRHRIEKIPELDENGDFVVDINGRQIFHYDPGSVGDICRQRVSDDIHNVDDFSRTIILPKPDRVQFVQSNIDDYFKNRRVK